MGLSGLTLNGAAPLAVEVAADLSFVLACATGCFFLIAVSLHGGTLVLSWIAVLAVQRIPFGAQLIGAPRRAVAMS